MAKVNLDDLVAGMVLADDAVHLNGRVLLQAGTELTEKHLKIFRAWGLTEATVVGANDEEIKQHAIEHLDPAQLALAEQKLQLLFSHLDMEHEPVAELYRLCVKDYAEQLTRSRE